MGHGRGEGSAAGERTGRARRRGAGTAQGAPRGATPRAVGGVGRVGEARARARSRRRSGNEPPPPSGRRGRPPRGGGRRRGGESRSRVVKRRSSARDDVEAPGSPTGRAPGSPSVLDGRPEAPAAIAFESPRRAGCGAGAEIIRRARREQEAQGEAQRERGRRCSRRCEPSANLSLARRTTPSDERGAATERPPEEVG